MRNLALAYEFTLDSGQTIFRTTDGTVIHQCRPGDSIDRARRQVGAMGYYLALPHHGDGEAATPQDVSAAIASIIKHTT